MQQDLKIVADGAARLRRAGNYEEERRQVLTELVRKYQSDQRRSSWWNQLWLKVKLRRALRAELSKKFPPGALHFSGTAQQW
jgi:hypothetical protein